MSKQMLITFENDIDYETVAQEVYENDMDDCYDGAVSVREINIQEVEVS